MKLKNFLIFLPFLWANYVVANDKYPTIPEKFLKGIARTATENPTKEQLDRRIKYSKRVEELGLPVSKHLPVIEDSKSIKPRSAKEISKRTIAVTYAAFKGEGVSDDIIMSHVKKGDILSYFSPEELEFIKNPEATERDHIKFAWRYEGLDVLLWALGYKDDLPPPNKICDVKTDSTIIFENEGGLLAKNSKLRDIKEILDMADYYYRLHWAAIELRINGKTNEAIDEGIIMERHYALNWLIRYMNQDWDSITTDT